MQVELVGGTFVDLASLGVRGLAVGSTVTDTDGATYRLAESAAEVDHDLYESVAGQPALRWIKQGVLSVADAAKLATVPSGFSIPFWYESATINLALVGASVTIVPAAPGFKFVPSTSRLRILTRNDAATTVPTCKTGTNGAHDNYGTVALSSTANINGVAAPMNISASLTTTVGVPELELTADLVTEVTIAAASAGTMAMTGRFVVFGALVAV